MERLLSEEFSIVLLEDEFISVFLSKLKSFVEKFSNEELKATYGKVEEELYSSKHEMTNLTECFIESIKSFITTTNSGSSTVSIINSNVVSSTITTNFPKVNSKEEMTVINSIEAPSLPTSASGSALKCSENDLGLDELLEYIHANDTNDVNQKKKGKSRNKKMKKLKKLEKSKKTDVNREGFNNTRENVNEYFPVFDEEVELFKNAIAKDNLTISCSRKIKPKFSKDWVRKIRDTVNETHK
jgi:hypothetical protein